MVFKDIVHSHIKSTRILKTHKYKDILVGIQGYTVVTGMVYKDIQGYICIHR